MERLPPCAALVVKDAVPLKSGALPLKPELNTGEDLIGAAVRQVRGLVQGRTVETRVNFDEPALVGRFDFARGERHTPTAT